MLRNPTTSRHWPRPHLGIALAALPPIALGATVALSPYGRRDGVPHPQLAESTDVAASCRQVFRYLGTSANAADWSIFVDHITPLNPDVAADGEVGSRRRSFRNSDESGMRWDEYFVDVIPERRRLLRIYGVVDAPLSSSTTLLSEQLYEPLATDRCRLTFTLYFEGAPTVRDAIGMHVASYEIARIFRRNIAQIGRLVEARATAGGS